MAQIIETLIWIVLVYGFFFVHLSVSFEYLCGKKIITKNTKEFTKDLEVFDELFTF